MKVGRVTWLLLPLVLLGIDFFSKVIAVSTISLYETRIVIPGFFNITMNHNYGAIFGSMSGASALLRAVVFWLAGIVALTYFGWEFLRAEIPIIKRVALGLILGGGLGNSVDRLKHGFVVDFLDFVFWGWHYWTFNIADSFILCGTILLLICSFKFGKKLVK